MTKVGLVMNKNNEQSETDYYFYSAFIHITKYLNIWEVDVQPVLSLKRLRGIRKLVIKHIFTT